MTLANVCIWVTFCGFALCCFAVLKGVEARINGNNVRAALFSPPLVLLCAITTLLVMILFLVRKVGLL